MDERLRAIKIFYRQAVMISLSMILSIFIYGGVGFYAIRSGHPDHIMVDPKIYRLLQFGAFVVSVLAILGARHLSMRMLLRTTPDPLTRHPKQLYVAAVVRAAAAEFPVLLGLILLFVSRDVFGFLPFAIVSLAAFAISFPRKTAWTQWLGVDF